MSTKSITIDGKHFNYEIVTYKAGTEELLDKNLRAKFGNEPIEALLNNDYKITIDAFVKDAIKNKEPADSLQKRIEQSLEVTIKNRLTELYCSNNPQTKQPISEEADDEGEEVVVDDEDDEKESKPEKEPEEPKDIRPPLFYAKWYYGKYAYIAIVMQEDLWELFASSGAKFKRMVIGWGEALKDPKKREQLGRWLTGTQSAAVIGAQAAINWAKDALQNKLDANRKSKEWKRQNKNQKNAEKFDDKEKDRRKKELEKANAGEQYRSFETAVDYDNWKQRQRNKILNKGLGRGAVRTREEKHDRWDPTGQVGTKKQIYDLLKDDFGEDIVVKRIALDKGGTMQMRILSPSSDNQNTIETPYNDEKCANNAIANAIKDAQTKNRHYFLVAPYQVDSNTIGYSIAADKNTKQRVNAHIRDTLRKESTTSRVYKKTKTLTFSQLKKIILESLKD